MMPRCNPFPFSLRSIFRRIPSAGLIWALAFAPAVVPAWAQTSTSAEGSGTRTPPAAAGRKATRHQASQRLREGTEIVDQSGYFRMTGGKVTFFTADGEGRFVGLESLSLERVARLIADNPEKLQWSVSGTVTEYRGANYLLIRRAILKSRVKTSDEIF